MFPKSPNFGKYFPTLVNIFHYSPHNINAKIGLFYRIKNDSNMNTCAEFQVYRVAGYLSILSWIYTTFTKYKQFVNNCFKVLPRQALHAKTLGFTHPTTGEFMKFNSDIPEDIADCLDKWRTYSENSKDVELE